MQTRSVTPPTGPGSDVIIIGAGVVGCAAADHLAAHGARVAVFDQGGIAAGASGRNAGAIEHPYDHAQSALYEETLNIYAELLGARMPEVPNGVLLLTDTLDEAQALADVYRGHPGLDPQPLDPDAATQLEPGLAGTGRSACLLATGYVVRPAAATEALAARAAERGAEFHLDSRARVEHVRGQVRGVRASGRLWPAAAVLVCAGAETSGVTDPTGIWKPIEPLWGVRMDVELPIPLRHVLLDGAVATIQSSSAHQDYAFVLIGTDRQASLGATFLLNKPRADQWADELLRRGAQRFPPLKQATPARPRLCARPRSFDGRPVLGPTNIDGLFIAAGHGGRGISTGPASARLAATAIIESTDAAIPHDLRASRYEVAIPEIDR